MSFGPGTLDLERAEGTPSPLQRRKEKRRFEWGALLAWTVGLGTFAIVGWIIYQYTQVEVIQEDLDDGAVLGADALAELEKVRIELETSDNADSAVLTFDDEEVEDPDIDGSVITWVPPEDLAEGEHELRVAVPRLVLGAAEHTWQFELDTTPPEVEVASVADRVAMDEPVSLEGTAEPDAEVSATAGEVTLGDDGAFTLDLTRPPAGPMVVTAVDRAGNETTAEVLVPVRYPTTRSVYVSAMAWADPARRAGVLALADQGRIDAVHLDLKDVAGGVSFDTTVDQAHDIGAVTQQYRLDDVVEAFRSRGVRVIGRVVAFHDPVYAGHAWSGGNRDQVVQAPSGGPYGGSTDYTNLAHPAVQDYNLNIALDAVERGVDEIVWEGVRPPDDGTEAMEISGLDGPAVDASSGFLARSHSELRRRGAYQGVATIGLTIYRDEAKDNLKQMARHVDYVVPIIEPEYWGAGALDVANPPSQPAEFVAAYIARIRKLLEGTGADVKPHLQAFGYSDDKVKAQVTAAKNAGVDSFVLFSPDTAYSASTLPSE